MILKHLIRGGSVSRYYNVKDEPCTNPAYCLIDPDGRPIANLALEQCNWIDRAAAWIFLNYPKREKQARPQASFAEQPCPQPEKA